MFPLTIILNRFPFAPAALPAFIATIETSDFPTLLLPPLLFRLVGKRIVFNQRQRGDLLGYRLFAISGSKRSQIPGGNRLLAFAPSVLLLAGPCKPSALSNVYFSGLYFLHGRLYPLPLFLASFRTYASSIMLPVCLQGSILGLWLAVTEAGVSPARLSGIAQPQHKDVFTPSCACKVRHQ
jgi:hypothetical protein